jgi:hypothetical protein
LADAEMAELLSAEPSPELKARIRQAVAGAEPSPAWRFGWLWPTMAALATLLVALAVWVERTPTPEPRVAVDEREPRPAATASVPGPVREPAIPRDSDVPRVVIPRDIDVPRAVIEDIRLLVEDLPSRRDRRRPARAVLRQVRRRPPATGVPDGPPGSLSAERVLVPPADRVPRFVAHLQTRVVLGTLLVADLSALAGAEGVEINRSSSP